MIIRKTRSVCPVCLANISAWLDQQPDGSVYMEKICPKHGTFRTIVWRGTAAPFPDGRPQARALTGGRGRAVPKTADCAASICARAAGVLLEVTRRCNLCCRFLLCRRRSGSEPSLDCLKEAVRDIAHRCSGPMLQLPGGEPTLRDDLPELIRVCQEEWDSLCPGKYQWHQTAKEPELARSLAGAGLDFVFLQFDGTDDRVYRMLRGRDLLEVKKRAIDNSDKAGLAVTLVPTVVPGVNLDDLGAMVAFAVNRSPAIRGVHFQPVSYFGRIPGGAGLPMRIAVLWTSCSTRFANRPGLRSMTYSLPLRSSPLRISRIIYR